MDEDNTIPISIINGVPYVWNAEDCLRLREEHRVVGALIGCLPQSPHQNQQLGLPLRLMKEEVSLLLNKGVCHLIDHSSPAPLPSQHEVEQFKANRAALYEQQVALCREQRRADVLRRREEILEGKRAKRRKVLEARQAAGETIDEKEFEVEIDLNVEDIKIERLPEIHSVVQIHTDKPGDQHEEGPARWSYPETPEEQLRCRVFTDLWEKGYFLTKGAKFGGDFLVYPGEPLRYHAFYIAVCFQGNKKLTGLELISLGRLGSSVKKTVLLCTVDDTDKLQYTSLQWTGIS